MVDRIRWDTVSYLPFYYVFFQFLLLTIFNLQANILTTKDILPNLGGSGLVGGVMAMQDCPVNSERWSELDICVQFWRGNRCVSGERSHDLWRWVP